MILNVCSVPEFLNVIRIIKLFINIIKVVVPIILIIVLMVKLTGAVSGGADALEKVKKSAITNIIAAVLIFLVPTFVDIIVRITPDFTGYDSCFTLANSESIAALYIETMEAMVSKVEQNYTYEGYTNAVAYLPKIEDEDKRTEFAERLEKAREANGGDDPSNPVTNNKELAIESITLTDVVVNIKASPGKNGIAGYYFSSIQKTPDVNGYDWIDTSATHFKVTKYPGTYYVYVKDRSGKIVGGNEVVVPKIFDVTLKHKGKSSMPVTLATYLPRHGSSLDKFNREISSYNKRHVYGTRESVVVGAMAFTGAVQSWGYYMPYGGSNSRIEKDAWGAYKYWGGQGHTFLACNPFVVWAYKQAGINIYGNRKKIKHDLCNTTRINGKGQTEYEKQVKPKIEGYSTVHIYYYFVGVLGSTKSYGDNIIDRRKGRSGDILQSYATSGHEMLIVDKYDSNNDGVSDGYIVLQSRDIGLCYEKVKYGTTTVYDMTAVFNNTASYAAYLSGWQQYFIPTSDYPSWMK